MTAEPRFPSYKLCVATTPQERFSGSPTFSATLWLGGGTTPNTCIRQCQEMMKKNAKGLAPSVSFIWMRWFAEDRSTRKDKIWRYKGSLPTIAGILKEVQDTLLLLKRLLLLFVKAVMQDSFCCDPIQNSSYNPIPLYPSFSTYLCFSLCLQIAPSDCQGTIPLVFMWPLTQAASGELIIASTASAGRGIDS